MKNSRMTGFTLIELMMVVAIIGILAGIAYPSYTEYVLRAKRGDGKAAILAAQLAQEKYRANNILYGTLAQIGASANSPDGNYTVSMATTLGTAYSITATPVHTDAYCATLVINQDGTRSAIGTDASNCWKK